MRIVYLIARSDEIGGAHIHVRDCALYMSRKGHEVIVIVGGNGVYLDMLEHSEINFIPVRSLHRTINPFYDLIAFFALWRIIHKLCPDIFSLHSAKAGFLGRLLPIRNSKVKTIFTAHGWSFADGISLMPRLIYLLIEQCLSFRCDKIICVCNKDRALALRKHVADKSKICTVYNGMPDLSGNYIEPRLGSEGPIRISCIARFEKQKDHATLLTALSRLTHYDWHLQLLGEGPLKDRIAAYAHSLNISERVSFLGRCDNVYPHLVSSDIFVLPSLWEGFPRSILEAMMMSLPIVASDVGGVSESVHHNVNGFLVPRRDVECWTNSLEHLLSSKSLRLEYGLQSRSLYVSMFSFDRMATQTLDLYVNILL